MKLIDAKDRYLGPRETYKAAGNVVAAAGVLPFLVIAAGSATKAARIKRIKITGLTLTAAQFLRIAVNKLSALPTGGTGLGATTVKLDSNTISGGTITVTHYTAGPTIGTELGPICEETVKAPAAAVAAGDGAGRVEFVFAEDALATEAPILRTNTQGLSVKFVAAPATAVTLSYEVEWTEDGN